ncbi:MAG: hypothetical protein KatS3mg016_1133 [Fimbriimonadales bacterium]|nr:MAG: hypothetical protein KatS3mg016_1133 [Fimbriimonadales bacterium]
MIPYRLAFSSIGRANENLSQIIMLVALRAVLTIQQGIPTVLTQKMPPAGIATPKTNTSPSRDVRTRQPLFQRTLNLFIADAKYSNGKQFLQLCLCSVNAVCLVRLRSNGVLYLRAPQSATPQAGSSSRVWTTLIFPTNMIVNTVFFVNFQHCLAKTRCFLIAFAFG